MKLDKRGWGTFQMLALLGILFFFFLLMIVLIIRFSKELYPNGLDLYNDNGSAAYVSVEHDIEEAANKYINSKYSTISNLDNIIISVDRLQTLNFYSNVGHEDCDGYVVSNVISGTPKSKAYIKCTDYVTKGYVNEYNE